MAPPMVECLCCFSTIDKTKVIKCNNKSLHPFCYECVANYVSNSVKVHKIELNCMDTNSCTGKFTEQDLRKCLSKELLEQFYKVEQKVYLRKLFNDELVSCPNCSIEMIHDGHIDNGIIICINKYCGQVSCSKCRKELHIPDPCTVEDQKRITKEEEDTYTVIKACPNCNTDIFKDGGCNHMICSRCKTDMCYRCGANITDNVAYHDCPNKYSRRTVERITSERVLPAYRSTSHRYTLHNSEEYRRAGLRYLEGEDLYIDRAGIEYLPEVLNEVLRIGTN